MHTNLRFRPVFSFTAGTWRRNNVVLTSMRRNGVASTSIRRHFDFMCPLGSVNDWTDWDPGAFEAFICPTISQLSPHVREYAHAMKGKFFCFFCTRTSEPRLRFRANQDSLFNMQAQWTRMRRKLICVKSSHVLHINALRVSKQPVVDSACGSQVRTRPGQALWAWASTHGLASFIGL